MQRDKIERELEEAAFNFFYRFSRFEFALKENGYLRSRKPGTRAEPDWNAFVEGLKETYELSPSAEKLIELDPKQQIVGEFELTFESFKFKEGATKLEIVVQLIRTVRNNLFHGGKHGAEGWDDPDRAKNLVTLANDVLEELATMADIHNDFRGRY